MYAKTIIITVNMIWAGDKSKTITFPNNKDKMIIIISVSALVRSKPMNDVTCFYASAPKPW